MSYSKLDLPMPSEESMKKHSDQWISHGMSAGVKLPTLDALHEMFKKVYAAADLPPAGTILTVDSPMEGALIAHALAEGLFKDLPKSGAVSKDVIADLKKTVDPKAVHSQLYNCGYGSHDAGWLSFYSYFLEHYPQVEGPQKLAPLMELAKNGIGWYWPFEQVVVVSSSPERIYTNHTGALHRSGGPALYYPDGFAVFALNGVRFSGDMVKYVTDDVNSLNPNEVLSIKNVEQRAEVIKRIGINVMFDKLSPKLLDTSNGYELYEVSIGYPQPRIYVKMNNPSVDEVHIEAVHPDCKTVAEALNWRNFGTVSKGYIAPEVLT